MDPWLRSTCLQRAGELPAFPIARSIKGFAYSIPAPASVEGAHLPKADYARPGGW